MKKIIAYSLYGNNPKYVKGVKRNVDAAKIYYPGWKVRVYTDQDLDIEGIEIIKRPPSEGHKGLFWRFEVLKDRSIDFAIVRDLDSLLGPREASAVNEWIESGKSFHTMRDHKFHAVPVCGGMWGCSSKLIKKIAPIYDELIQNHMNSMPFTMVHSNARGAYFNTDQPFLWRYIWPLVINDNMAHIQDLPELKITGNERVFTVENEDGTFVGQDL